MTYTPAQSRRLCEWLAINVMGVNPTITHEASSDGGESSAMSSRDPWGRDSQQGRRAVAEFCERFPQYKVVEVEHWPRYTESLLAAFEVVEKMRGEGMLFDTGSPFRRPGVDAMWWARFTEAGRIPEIATAQTPTLAICLAAIRAKGGDVEKIAGDPA